MFKNIAKKYRVPIGGQIVRSGDSMSFYEICLLFIKHKLKR